MASWALYPVFIATFLSVTGWIYFMWRWHDVDRHTPLSIRATRSRAHATYYRTLMLACPLLFTITALWFVAPRTTNIALVVLWLIATISCIFTGIFLPTDSHREKMLHDVFAYTMAAAMLVLAYTAAITLPSFSVVLWLTATTMTLIALVGTHRKNHYVLYEMGFIFLSHFSMIIITLTVI